MSAQAVTACGLPHFAATQVATSWKNRCADKPLCVSALRRILSCLQLRRFFPNDPSHSALCVDADHFEPKLLQGLAEAMRI